MTTTPTKLHVQDPAYTERLAAYLRSLGQRAVVLGPSSLEVDAERDEVEACLRVWRVLYPDADVRLDA